VSDRIITRPAAWSADFVTDLGRMASEAEAWTGEIEDTQTAQTAPWAAYLPGIIVALTAAEYAAGTGTGLAANLTAAVALTHGSLLVKYALVRAETFYAITLTLPSECRWPPCLSYAARSGGVQIPTKGSSTTVTIGPNTDGSLLAADMYVLSVRYPDAGAPETGDWLLENADYGLDLNTIAT